MATTIIDKLIVELGLDPKQFNRGTKEAATEVKSAQEQISYSAGEMVGALQRVAAEFVSLFLVVNGVKDVVGLFGELNEQTRQLGIDSRNLGQAANELRDWGNVSELAGGKAEDASTSIQGLEKSIFNVKQGFGWDEQLTNFLRLNVDTGVATGKMRDFHSILLDTAKALQSMDKPDRFQWVQKLGLQGGIGNAVVEGPEALERYYAKEKALPQINGGDTAAAARLAQAFELLKQRVEAVATKILTAVEPALEGLANAISGFLQKNQGKITTGINDLAAWAQGPGPGQVISAVMAFAQSVVDATKYINDAVHPFRTVGRGIAGAFGGAVDANKLDNQEAQVAREKEAATAKYGLPKDFWKRDNTPLGPGSADAYASIIAQQHAALGGDKGDPTWDKSYAALAARNKALSQPVTQVPGASPNPTALKAATGAVGSPAARSTAAQAASGPPTAANLGGVTNNVTGDIFVQTQAKDANGVAAGINGALQRKLTVTQADGALS